MRCSDCGGLVKEDRKKEQVKVTLSNPGAVFFEAKTLSCTNCGQKFVHEDDMEEALDNFQDACTKAKGSHS